MANTSNGGVPPGFRFHPTDEELLHYYLKKKVSFQKFDMEVIREVDLNKMEPWDLQERCRIGSTPQNEWYFFSHKDRKYPTGSRTNRATSAGFWKATGRDKCIRNSYKKIGMRKTLVFYRGRAPHGQKTDWIMHEYRLEDGDDPLQNSSSEDGWVVCRVFKKKNLFKIGSNNDQGGTTSANSSDHHQQLNPLNSTNNNQYLMPQHRFQLKHHDLALHYPPPNIETNPLQYSLLHSQTQLMPPHNNHKPIGLYEYVSLPTETPLVMVKQLMTGVRNRESGSESQMRYQACEAGLEVGSGTTSEPAAQQMIGAGEGAGAARTGRDEGLNEWAMLDRIVSSHHLGNEDSSSKGVRYEDGNGGAAHSINQLSLRGERDFWGYEK